MLYSFVVPGNGQVLIGMPDVTSLNIVKINIDSIQADIAECKTSNKQKCKVDVDTINKQDVNSQKDQKSANKLINYFFSSNNTDADKRKSSKMIQKIHDRFGNIFNGIGCFKGTFSLQLKPDSKPYQPPQRHVAYILQKPFKEELEQLQKMDIITPLGVDEMAEWCNSFVLAPKANSKVQLCLDPAWLNQALIRPIHHVLTLNDILPKLNNVQYMSIIDASSGYHNLKLDTQLSYLTTFACPFGRYHYKHLPFGAVLVVNMFQRKIDKIFNDSPNVFGIADDILVIGHDKDRADHDEAIYSVLR